MTTVPMPATSTSWMLIMTVSVTGVTGTPDVVGVAVRLYVKMLAADAEARILFVIQSPLPIKFYRLI